MAVYLLLFQFIQLINLLRHLSNGVLMLLLQTGRKGSLLNKNPRTKRAGLNRTDECCGPENGGLLLDVDLFQVLPHPHNLRLKVIFTERSHLGR